MPRKKTQKPLTWTAFSYEVDGQKIEGEWAVDRDAVHVRSRFGSKKCAHHGGGFRHGGVPSGHHGDRDDEQQTSAVTAASPPTVVSSVPPTWRPWSLEHRRLRD